MQSVSEEMQELQKRYQLQEQQWRKEKALMQQKIEHLEKVNRELAVKVDAQEIAFNKLLTVFPDAKTQNSNNFVSLTRNEHSGLNQQPLEAVSDILNQLNVE